MSMLERGRGEPCSPRHWSEYYRGHPASHSPDVRAGGPKTIRMVVYHSDEVEDRPRATRGVIRLLCTVAQRPAPDRILLCPDDDEGVDEGSASKPPGQGVEDLYCVRDGVCYRKDPVCWGVAEEHH